ncbi:MAG: hemolysin family protein [Myxococcales bacterium]|nr:hemolysin family protein [Myxococcales bacterium]
MAGLLLFTIFLVFANGFFVAAEFALVKVRSTQLDAQVDDGARFSVLARSMLNNLDSYLSATQLGITLTSLGLGWIGEPAVAHVLEPVFLELEVPEEMTHRISFVLGFSIISFLHIVIGEVAPKSLAIARPVGVSLAVSAPLRAFHWIFYPALAVLNASANLILRAVGVEPANSHSLAVGGDELVRMAQASAAEGHISTHEGELVDKIFAFSDRVASEIMIPRHQVHAIELDAPIGPQLTAALDQGHSRYPVFLGDLDHAVGIVHLKDLLHTDLTEVSAEKLRNTLRPMMYVPGTLPAQKVMRRMQQRRSHLSLVLDESGGVAGLVTLEDALEELVGEIQDEYDHEELEEVQPLEDGGYALAGGLLLVRVAALLRVPAPESRSTTLQGWLMEMLERVPESGDTLPLGDWSVEVVDVEDRTVVRAEATRSID